MKVVFVFILSFIAMISYAQKKISLEEVKNHIGDSVEVRGKVSGIAYMKNTKGSPTIISVGGKSPKQLLSIIIFANVRKKLNYNPQQEKYLQGIVIATGKLELYKGKPQIVIRDPKQLGFVHDEEVPASQIPPIDKQ